MSDATEYSNSPIFDTLIDHYAWRRVLDAKAQAWEEGFIAGERDVWMHQETDDWNSPCIKNPYRRGY